MLHLAALTSAWQSNLKGMLLSDILELELSYTLKTVAVALLCLFEIAVCFIFWTIFIWKSTAFVENETMVWWQSPMINLKLRRQMNKVILSGPAMASHCCTILYPEMRIRNLIAFAQQMSWTQILMMVSTLSMWYMPSFLYLLRKMNSPGISIVHITVHSGATLY